MREAFLGLARRAAEQVGLSQPAVSAQLARLRRHFGDELLARMGNQYRLTPLAIQLRQRVRSAVSGGQWECTSCSARNYRTPKETRGADRLELKKYCPKERSP